MGTEPRALSTDDSGDERDKSPSQDAQTPVEGEITLPTVGAGDDLISEYNHDGLPEYLLRDAVAVLWREVLDRLLEGTISPAKIAKEIGCNTELVRKVLNDTEFIKIYDASKQDMAVSAVDRVRAKAHIWMNRMERLTVCPDPHVARAALTDLLNRAGTAATTKVDLGVAAYRKAVERYIEPEE